jgi:uncharacterized membrane-anchored protein YjiN (DUF445 family)
MNPNPETPNPNLETPNPETPSSNLETQTINPETQISTPKPETQNLKPQTINQESETPNQKPQTKNQKLEPPTLAFSHGKSDEEKRAALVKMKRIATAMLGGAAIIFLVTLTQHGFWWELLKAVAEASMVGAIADWFAVTALFRHPLGIPIPHTAIIPHNKKQIGNSLGNFIQKYFLNPELVRDKIKGVNMAEQVGKWLMHPHNTKQIIAKVVEGTPKLLARLNDEHIKSFIEQNVTSELKKVELAPKLGAFMENMTDSKQFEPLLEALLKNTADWILRNEDKMKGFIKEHKPWYIPKAVYEPKLFDALPKMLYDVFHDPEHPRRQDVMNVLRSMASNLQTNPEWVTNGNEIRDKILENETFRAYIRDIWTTQKQKLSDDIHSEDSRIAQAIDRGTRRLGIALLKDKDTQEALNRNIEDIVVNLVAQRGQEFAGFIAETLEKWDSDTMVERIELSVGRDLQFIRVNGTLVGGLVGGLLYLLTQLAKMV